MGQDPLPHGRDGAATSPVLKGIAAMTDGYINPLGQPELTLAPWWLLPAL